MVICVGLSTSYEEVLIKEAEGIIHGYLPEIDGIIYED